MENLVINSVVENKTWVCTDAPWKLVGNSQHPQVENAFSLSNFNCQIYKIGVNDEDLYEGDASGYKANDGFKIAINNVPTADLAAVAQVLEELVTALSE